MFFYEIPYGSHWSAPPGHALSTPSEEEDLYFRIYYEGLDPVPVAIPLVHVNQEARSVACFHAKKLGYKVFQNEETKTPILARGMDRVKDVLYLGQHGVEEIDEAYHDELIDSELINIRFPNPTQYGIYSKGCRSSDLTRILDYPWYADAVYIFQADKEDEWQVVNTRGVQKQRVEPDTCGWRIRRYNAEVGCWEWGPGEVHPDVNWNRILEDDLGKMRLTKSLTDDSIREFCIKLVKSKVVEV